MASRALRSVMFSGELVDIAGPFGGHGENGERHPRTICSSFALPSTVFVSTNPSRPFPRRGVS
jgi:hypothetical protein